MTDKRIRSITKALSWRICGTFITSALVFIFTRQWELSIGIGVLDFGTKVIAYYFHERAWLAVGWGKQELIPIGFVNFNLPWTNSL